VAERTVQEWLDEIDDAIEYREKFAREDSWNELEDCFYNEQDSYASVGPNVIFETGDTLLSGLIVPDPDFSVDALDVESVANAGLVERLSNRLVGKPYLNLKQEIEQASVNNYLNGKGILKIGYDSEFGYDPRYDMGTIQTPLGFTRTQYDKQGRRIEYKNVKPGMMWVKAVHPYDFVVPWGSGQKVDDLPWVAHRFIRETAYLKKDPKYINTSRLEPQMSMRDFQTSYTYGNKSYRRRTNPLTRGSIFGKTDSIFNEVWEIHDRVNQKIYCVCHSHAKFLRKDDDAIQKALRGKLPFVTGNYVWSNRHFWTPPMAYYLGQHQKDQYDIHLQAGKQRRINVAKFIMTGDAMEDNEIDKLTSGDVAAVAKAKKHIKDPSKIFWPMPTGSNQELLAEAEYSRRNSRSVMGFSRNQAGEFDASSRRTAYEASKVFDGTQTRMQKKEDVTKDMYTETIQKVIDLVIAFWKTPRTVESYRPRDCVLENS
jgi:hypothetical protein